MNYGLLGARLSHSFSPQIHRELWGADYGLFPLDQAEAAAFLDSRAFLGLNVTIPYKVLALEKCDQVDSLAARIGAVNTVVNRSGKLYGYNTDYHGLLACLQRGGLSLTGKKVLIFGSGGTSATARAVAEDCGAGETVIISRSGPNPYETLSRHYDGEILINTTPVGLYPNSDAMIVDPALFPNCSGVADVVYNPLRTRLLCRAEELGLPTAGGLCMLVVQAQIAAAHLAGVTVSDARAETCLKGLERACRNLVLIGMPGCGKTTLGRALAKTLDMPFVDLDKEIALQAGMSVPAMISAQGEAAFRDMETQVLRRVSSEHAQVIATGGGAVLREENRFFLRQNGMLFYVDRPLSSLATAGRPLSAGDGATERLYAQRRSIYESLCDIRIPNTGSITQAVEQIKEVWLR